MDESFSLTTQVDSQFRDEISTKRVEFDKWVEEKVSSFGLAKDTHTRTMEKLTCKICFNLLFIFDSLKFTAEYRELSEQEKVLRMKSEHLQISFVSFNFYSHSLTFILTEMQQENAELNQLQDQLKELQCEESSLPPILSSLRSDLEKEKDASERKKQGNFTSSHIDANCERSFHSELLKAKQVKEYKVAELSKGLSFYQQRLGLDIKKTPGVNILALSFPFLTISFFIRRKLEVHFHKNRPQGPIARVLFCAEGSH